MRNTGRQNSRDSSRPRSNLWLFIELLCCCAALTASARAQQLTNFDDISSSGTPRTITNIQRLSGIVTANLSGNLPVGGGNTFGLIDVTISTGDTSFAGTFVVQTGSGTSTLTWNQSGLPNTGVLTPTGTVIARGWGLCSSGPSCAGGSGTPTSTSQTFDNATPSLDGGSMMLSETGPSFSDTGWFYNAGANNAATGFTLDLQFNIPSNTNIQALEFDQFQYLKAPDGGVAADTRLFFGTECVKGSVWNVWDSSGIGWVSTGVSCSYIVSSTAFNHLTIAVHRLAGDTSCLSGYPCMYYTITLNGTVVVANAKTNSGALPSTFGEQTGFMIQLDTSSACGTACTINEYIDRGIFSGSNMASWWPAVQQNLQN